VSTVQWDAVTDDDLLDRLGIALAPAEDAAAAAGPVLVPLPTAAMPSPPVWRRPLAWAAAIAVVSAVAAGFSALRDDTEGVGTIEPAVPGTIAEDPEVRVAQLALAALEAALATGDATTVEPAADALRAALETLDTDQRALLGDRPAERLTEVDALLATTTTTSVTGEPATPTAPDPGATTATTTTVEDHGGGGGGTDDPPGDDNSGPGSISSGSGSSGSSGSESGSGRSSSDD
jgi:eukaryotic-like serine/threonine-protein kinase